jgi:hypothetical protein
MIVRYRGPHEEEIASTGFAEGNSNLTGQAPASPSPSAGAVTPERSTTPTVRATNTAASWGPLGLAAAALVLAALVLGLVAGLRFRR